MDDQPAVNGRVSSRELYAAINGLREELGSAQRVHAADVMAPIAATEHRLCVRVDRLEATVNEHDDTLQQLRGARSLLNLVFGVSVLTAVLGLLTLAEHLR